LNLRLFLILHAAFSTARQAIAQHDPEKGLRRRGFVRASSPGGYGQLVTAALDDAAPELSESFALAVCPCWWPLTRAQPPLQCQIRPSCQPTPPALMYVPAAVRK